jgi:hypothetical protein
MFAAALLGTAALTTIAMSSASAAPPAALTCSGGGIASGTYSSIIVTGECQVPDGATVVVLHNLTVAPGAVFDAQTDSTVTINGNVLAGPGSLFGLGCTEAHPCEGAQPATGATQDSVAGNVILNHVYNAAINGDHIGGNLISTGGGAETTADGFVPFSVKDNTIDGNVVVTGLRTVWFGIIRSTIGGNVVLTNNVQSGDPDANEIVANSIGRNLICQGNFPAPQFGDAVAEGPAGYGPNTVGGHATGQCTGLVG